MGDVRQPKAGEVWLLQAYGRRRECKLLAVRGDVVQYTFLSAKGAWTTPRALPTSYVVRYGRRVWPPFQEDLPSWLEYGGGE